ncbi:hypothetical protein PGIGA_G00144860 [Pangasianodon gigas]|uniref:Uncharacterized protein n=1 Tax=Pangasianodon gigas TaxID=30993 RepID=A0ACC5XM28_PANGG|nr:hypothetical protein [Pangasianodon gigas]
MKTYMMLVVLFGLMIAASVSSLAGFKSTVRKLHQPATLSCEGKCSGSVKWTKIQKPSGDVVVARCDRTSCSSEEGFLVSRDQYLEGNLSLTVTAADYSRRGWYTCQCDGEDVCSVSLRFEPVELMKQICPGDSLVMDVRIPERVEVVLRRSGDDGAQSAVSVPLCSIAGRNVQCEPEYEKRVVFSCSLTLTAVKDSDSGVYAVRDADNDEIISTHTLTLTGNKTDVNNTLPAKGKQDSWNMKRIFEEEYRGVIVGLVLGVCVFGAVCSVVKRCSFIWRKVKKCWRRDRDHSSLNGKFNPVESMKLRVCD